MATITEAQAKKLATRSRLFRYLVSRYGDGFYQFLKNFDADDGSLTASVGDALSGTTGDSFTLASGETDGKFKLSVNTTGTNHTVELKAPVTTQAVTLTLPDVSSDTIAGIAAAQTLTNKTLTTPTIGDFTNATHDHSNAAGGGALSLPSLTGTTQTTFTVFEGGATARLILDTASATGDYDLSLTVPNLAAAAVVTLPDETATLATLGLNETFSGAKTFSGGIVASGSYSNDFSGGSGTFKTSTGANTLSGDVTIAANKDLSMASGTGEIDFSSASGTFKTSTGAAILSGDTTVAANKDLVLAKGTGYVELNAQTSGSLKIQPTASTAQAVTLTTAGQTGGAGSVAIPDLVGGTVNFAVDGVANAFTAVQSVTVDDATNNGVTDVLTLSHTTSGSPAAGIGVGLSFQVEDDGGAEQQGSIDVSLTTTTNGSEDADMILSVNANGAIVPGMTLDASDQSLTVGANSTDADGFYQVRIYPVTASRGSLILKAQAHASADRATTVQTATDASAAVTLTLPNATSTIVGDAIANTFTAAQTIDLDHASSNNVQTVLTLARTNSGGNGASGIGGEISLKLENDAGTEEEHASIQWITDAADGAEVTDLVFNTMLGGGAVGEAMRLDVSDASLTLGVTGINTINRLRIYAPSANKGTLELEAADGGGDYTVVIKPGSVSASAELLIPDTGGNDTFVMEAASATLTNKRLDDAVLKTPQIHDTSLDHQYVFAVNELAADRTVTLPLLTGDDEFTFNAHTATLTNKTIDDDNNVLSNIAYTAHKAAVTVNDASVGTVVALEFAITDGDPDDSFTVPADGNDLRVLDAWVVKDTLSADAGDTVQIKNASTAITDALGLNIADHARAGFTTFDDAQRTIAAGAVLNVDGTNSTNCSCRVYVLAMWV